MRGNRIRRNSPSPSPQLPTLFASHAAPPTVCVQGTCGSIAPMWRSGLPSRVRSPQALFRSRTIAAPCWAPASTARPRKSRFASSQRNSFPATPPGLTSSARASARPSSAAPRFSTPATMRAASSSARRTSFQALQRTSTQASSSFSSATRRSTTRPRAPLLRKPCAMPSIRRRFSSAKTRAFANWSS